MNYFKGIVELTESQYTQLKVNGSITINNKTITYDDNTLYVTPYVARKISELENDMNYVSLNDVGNIQIKFVDSLPTTGIENIIYYVPDSENANQYTRHIYLNGRFESKGTASINLSEYAKISQIPTTLPASDVYDWAKLESPPTYLVKNSEKIVINANDEVTIQGNKIIQSGTNSSTGDAGISILRNCNNQVHQVLITLNDDGSINISHRNRSVNANLDDYKLKITSSGVYYNDNKLMTQDEVQQLIQGQ